jgi:hypothetical protein
VSVPLVFFLNPGDAGTETVACLYTPPSVLTL